MSAELQAGSVLVVVEGVGLGRWIQLGGSPVTIGRWQHDDFVLQDPCITKNQLLVEWDQQFASHVVVQTGDSFTAINQQRIPRNMRYRHVLCEGDHVQIGRVVLLYLRLKAPIVGIEATTLPVHVPTDGNPRVQSRELDVSAALCTLASDLPEAVTILRYLVFIPPKTFELDWLRQLVARYHPRFKESVEFWVKAIFRLLEDQLLLIDETNSQRARAPASVMTAVRDGLDEASKSAMHYQLLAFCTLRLDSLRQKKTALRNEIMTGNPEVAATGWTTPSLEEVQSRAEGLESVVVQDFGDGSYRLHFRPEYAEEFLTAVAEQEFAATELFRIEWALNTSLLPYEVLSAAEERLGELYLQDPNSELTARLSAQYWLCSAHKYYGNGGSCRGAFNLAGKAVEILEDAVRSWGPHSNNLGELLEEAQRARWSYDD